MSLAVVLWVGLLGGAGAVGRFALDGALSSWTGRDFPYGTLAVNLLGTFGLGILVGVAAPTGLYRLVGTGLVGGFTTFSTWVLESHRLGEDGQARLGALNLALSLVLGIAVAWLGRYLGGRL